jgi:hypothetical protein
MLLGKSRTINVQAPLLFQSSIWMNVKPIFTISSELIMNYIILLNMLKTVFNMLWFPFPLLTISENLFLAFTALVKRFK